MSVQTTISFRTKKMLFNKVYEKDEKENMKHACTKDINICSPRKDIVKIIKSKRRKNFSESNTGNVDCSPPKQSKVTPSPCNLIKDLRLSVETKDADKALLVSKAIRALHAVQPNELYGRQDKIDTISSILKDCVENNKSSTLYISGPPGTGKTASVNVIVSQAQVTRHYNVVYVNCTGINSSGAIFEVIADKLSIKLKGKGEKKAVDTLENYFRTKHKMILLILDEMDHLESKKQPVLYTLFEWASRPELGLVLIGIANALDLTDRVLPRLQTRLELRPILIHFSPYTREQIIEIIKHRLTEAGVTNVLTGPALQFLASKVSAVSGDIRRALDIGRRVIELGQLKATDGQQVTLQDVLTVVNSAYGTTTFLAHTTTEGEEGFPLQQKLYICCIILMIKNSKTKVMTIGKLHDVYKKVCTKRNVTPLDMSEFLSLSELVESRGVVRIQGKMKNRFSKVALQWDESEITNALQDKNLLGSILVDLACLN